MSTVIAFDTLKFAVTLRDAGVPPQQAEAQARAFAEIFQVNLDQLVSKQEFDEFRQFVAREFENVRKESKADFESLRKESKADFEVSRREWKQELAELEHQMDLRFAQVEHRFVEIEAKIDHLDAKVDRVKTELVGTINLVHSQLRSEQLVVRWMLGFVLAGMVTLIVRLFLMKTV